MPFDFQYLNRHLEIPAEIAGYELSPGSGKGLWYIVSPSGTVTNLNDLGLQVLAYTGAGMPPVENITTPLGILGGSYLQRTVVRPRTIILSCIAQGLTFAQVQRIKNQVIAQVAPYNSLNSSKSLKLRYQLTNYCGDAVGTLLEVPVTYAGDLSGQTTNLYQDRFDLQFVEYAPPSIHELTTIQPSLGYNTTRTTVAGIRYRTSTGNWNFISLASPGAVHYDATGELWYGSNATITNRSGSVTQTLNNFVFAITHDQNNVIYAAGSFTTPNAYIEKYSGGVWTQVGATINNSIFDMAFDNAGNLYAAGQFTTPAGGIGMWNGSTWSALGTGTNGLVNAVIKGLDGYIYIGGAFTAANGVSCSNIAKWDPVAATFVPLGSGVNNTVYSLAVLPDGRLVAGGIFQTAGGISCLRAAVWNGTQWQPLGAGLDNQVFQVAVNPLNGDIYATGIFGNSGTRPLTSRLARFNGSLWTPVDAINNNSTILEHIMDIRASDGEFAIITSPSAGNISNGTLNSINYTGTADVFPQIKFTGPGTLWAITNYTTGKSIYFNNYTMLAGETATFSYDPINGVQFISSFYGKQAINRILTGSDYSAFSLAYGQTNNIVPFITGGTGATKVELIYQNTHYSFEAGAG